MELKIGALLHLCYRNDDSLAYKLWSVGKRLQNDQSNHPQDQRKDFEPHPGY